MADGSEMRVRLVRLATEIAQDRPILAALGGEIGAAVDRITDGTPADLALIAVKIHRWYTALEMVLQRIERTLASEPDGGDWHFELLRGATLDLPGVRPPVLPKATLGSLREVLRFRHFFRHAYAVELDGAKLARVARHVALVRADVDAAIGACETFVRQLSAALVESP